MPHLQRYVLMGNSRSRQVATSKMALIDHDFVFKGSALLREWDNINQPTSLNCTPNPSPSLAHRHRMRAPTRHIARAVMIDRLSEARSQSEAGPPFFLCASAGDYWRFNETFNGIFHRDIYIYIGMNHQTWEAHGILAKMKRTGDSSKYTMEYIYIIYWMCSKPLLMISSSGL